MKESLLIRAATVEYAPLLLELIRELAAYEKLAPDVTATVEGVRESIFVNRYAEALLAFCGEHPVGFSVYYFGYSTFVAKPTLYVEDLYVREAFRRKGIGCGLFVELLACSARRGCGRVEWSVLDWNESAIRFYERLGAQEQGEWRRYRLSESAMGAAIERLKPLANQGWT